MQEGGELMQTKTHEPEETGEREREREREKEREREREREREKRMIRACYCTMKSLKLNHAE